MNVPAISPHAVANVAHAILEAAELAINAGQRPKDHAVIFPAIDPRCRDVVDLPTAVLSVFDEVPGVSFMDLVRTVAFASLADVVIIARMGAGRFGGPSSPRETFFALDVIQRGAPPMHTMVGRRVVDGKLERVTRNVPLAPETEARLNPFPATEPVYADLLAAQERCRALLADRHYVFPELAPRAGAN